MPEEGAETGPHNANLTGQISLQALLDQSTAPPGFYMSPSQDLVSSRQDLDRAKSTPYHVNVALPAMHSYLATHVLQCRGGELDMQRSLLYSE